MFLNGGGKEVERLDMSLAEFLVEKKQHAMCLSQFQQSMPIQVMRNSKRLAAQPGYEEHSFICSLMIGLVFTHEDSPWITAPGKLPLAPAQFYGMGTLSAQSSQIRQKFDGPSNDSLNI